MNKNNSLCICGQKSERLLKTKADMNALRQKISIEIEKSIDEGINTFYFGANYGFDLLCAEIIINRRKIIKIDAPLIIKLVAVVPCEEQANDWSECSRELYYNTLAKCDDVIILSNKCSKESSIKSDRYMVDASSKMICYYDAWGINAYMVCYAKKRGLNIVNLYDGEFMVKEDDFTAYNQCHFAKDFLDLNNFTRLEVKICYNELRLQ